MFLSLAETLTISLLDFVEISDDMMMGIYLDGILDLNPFVPPPQDDGDFVPAKIVKQSHDRFRDFRGRR